MYRDKPNPPPGFRVANAADLAKLGLTPGMLETDRSTFRARVYVSGTAKSERFVVAFRGSTGNWNGEDWSANFRQGAGGVTKSYDKALKIGQMIALSNASVTLTGHSLGGGLASAAAIAGGRDADTFNASGLSSRTIATASEIHRAAIRSDRSADVEAFHVRGDVLTFLQAGGDRAVETLVLGPTLTAPLPEAPTAYGHHVELPDVAPSGKTWEQRHSPIDRHMIDWVVTQANALPQ